MIKSLKVKERMRVKRKGFTWHKTYSVKFYRAYLLVVKADFHKKYTKEFLKKGSVINDYAKTKAHLHWKTKELMAMCG